MGLRIIPWNDEVSKQYGANTAQVSLAWLMGRPGVTAPIVSATSLEQLGDLIKSTQLKLDAQAMNLLNQASA